MEKEGNGTNVQTKGDLVECGSYRVIKLTQRALSVLERVVDKGLRQIVEIDGIPIGFMNGRGTTDTIMECEH